MRKWNDKEPVKIRHKKIFAVAIAGSFGLSIFHYVMFGYLSFENIAGIALATFLIYGIWFGGMYKIMRWYAERKAKKFDNDWSPKWTK